MNDFETSLLRERFAIRNLNNKAETKPMVALSNRIVITLSNENNLHTESFVIRGQNMHCCLRMGARILYAYRIGGFLLNRSSPFDWDKSWRLIFNDFERKFNPALWLTVYHDGSILFEMGERHPLKRVGEPQDIANVVEFLLSDKSTWVTGQVLGIDGGLSTLNVN